MKKDILKRFISIFLMFVIMISILTVNANAEILDAKDDVETVNKISWRDKISDDVLVKMQSLDKKDRIPVWIWFSDIDQEEVDKQVKKDTGLSSDNIAVDYKVAPDDLIGTLEKASDKKSKSSVNKVTKKIQAYLKSNVSKRGKELFQYKKYINARRQKAKEFYVKHNSELIKKLNISQRDIDFQSELTPSTIANLTKTQIKSIAKSYEVDSIDYYDSSENAAPLCENARETMRANKASEDFGLTGDSVNVLVNDHGCVRSDADNFSYISNPDNIKVIVNGNIYPVTATDVMPGSNSDTHPNLIAAEMQAYAPDVHIFSVGYGCYSDVEWAILNCDIQLINGSINLGSYSNYQNDAPAKWFDALVSTNNVALIASAGNSKSWQETGWPNLISPASGYNSIAAGTYGTNGSNPENDYMYYQYRCNPTTGSDLVCYKPDMLVAAGSTSQASPAFSGIISLLVQLKPALAANPELIKAVLMASCHRKVNPAVALDGQETMIEGLTQRQGAGAIDVYRAISIVLQNNYGISEITNGYEETSFVQNENGNNVNVSIAWLRKNVANSNNPNGGTALGNIQELVLRVYEGTELKGLSDKTNTGKQMVYFSSSNNDQYTIRVTKTSQNSEPVRYAYAWSTEETNGKHIILSTSNANGVISREEVSEQLLEAGISINQSNETFWISFDKTVKGIGVNAFSGYGNLTNVTIRNGITSIGDYSFSHCSALKEIDLPDSVANVGEYVFNYCEKIRSVKLSKNLESIPIGMFYACNHIENIEIPNKVVSIERSAFQGCSNLKKVTIGNGVIHIHQNAFYGCASLNKVYFNPEYAPSIGSNAFGGLPSGAKGYVNSGYYGYADSYDNLTIYRETDMRTYYFTNSRSWQNVNVYLWKNGTSQNNTWPGVTMSRVYTNYLGQDVYSIEVDHNVYNKAVFNNGDQEQTEDIDLDLGGNGFYLLGNATNNKWLVSTFTPDIRTIYFTNNYNWTNLKAYMWKDGEAYNNYSWPGVSMEFASTNGYGQGVFSITFDYNEFDRVIFNDGNGQAQTVNINVGANGTGYYLTGGRSDDKWLVNTYVYQ